MKVKLLIITIVFTLTVTSCSDYLDVVPDNTVTIEDLFKTQEETYDALAKVYSYNPHPARTNTGSFVLGDEFLGRLDYNGVPWALSQLRIMRGLQSPSNPQMNYWGGSGGATDLYEGIRNTHVFAQNIGDVPDMSNDEKKSWKAQAHFMRAWYYWQLVKRYGPVVITGGIVSADAQGDELLKPRSKVEVCFQHILDLIDKAIPELETRVAVTSENAGQVDQVIAKAIKARILLFRASPFWNGNQEYFGNFTNKDGEYFFPMEYDRTKWEEALDAVNEAIEAAAGLSLYQFKDPVYDFDKEAYKQNQDKVQTLYDLRFSIIKPWNSGLIWGYSNISRRWNQGDLPHSTNMRLPNTGEYEGVLNNPLFSWQWMGATYRMTERFYTENGVPITQDKTFDEDNKWKLTETPGVEDPAYTKYYGLMQPGAETINLYLNREPRFYANLMITGGYHRSHQYRIPTMMYEGTDGGIRTGPAHDYYPTGIGVKKWVHMESKSGHWARVIKYPFPIIRMADLYLMKAEILNELQGPGQEVYNAINRVRERAGIPDVEEVWSDPSIVKDANKHTTKRGMREIILHERSVEFAFEGSHFWDMVRYKKARSEFSQPIYGWKPKESNGQGFFNLEVKQGRNFTTRDHLWPISLQELNTNSKLIQNPGWAE